MSDESTQPNPEGEALPIAERHRDIRWALKRFTLQLDVLRDMAAEVNPERLEPEDFGANVAGRMKALPQEKRQRLELLIIELAKNAEPDAVAEGEAARAGDDSSKEGEESSSADVAEAAGEPSSGESAKAERGLGEKHVKELNEIFEGDKHFIAQFLRALVDVGAGPHRATILANSLLTMAISGFEVLIASVVTQYFVRHPDVLEKSDKSFNLKQLKEFDNIEDASDALIGEIVSDLMREGFEAWCRWFKKFGNADFQNLANDLTAVEEAFQRRHVVIHNGGLVTRQYIAKVNFGADEPPAVGDRLKVDAEYLINAFDELEVLGIAVSTGAWFKWFDAAGNESAGAMLMGMYELMLDESWSAVRHLATVSQNFKCSESRKASMMCNGLYAEFKMSGDREVIRERVEAWDTSALSGRFQLVQHVLAGDLDRALGEIPELVKSGDIEIGEILEWPILEEVRGMPGYSDMMESVQSK